MYVYIGGTPAVLDVYKHLHLVAGPQGPVFDPGSAPTGSPMQAIGFCLSSEYTGHRTQFSVYMEAKFSCELRGAGNMKLWLWAL